MRVAAKKMVALAWEMGLVTPKDIRLYNKKKERLPLPEWAAVKINAPGSILIEELGNA